jgi:hypothetical protein
VRALLELNVKNQSIFHWNSLSNLKLNNFNVFLFWNIATHLREILNIAKSKPNPGKFGCTLIRLLEANALYICGTNITANCITLFSVL